MSAPTVFEWCHLTAAMRADLERHLATLGFGPLMARCERRGRREACRVEVTVADVENQADLLYLAELVGYAPTAVTDPAPGRVYLMPGASLSRDTQAALLGCSTRTLLEAVRP
jgi:hypothetical protein